MQLLSLISSLLLLGLVAAGPFELDNRAGCDRDNVFRCILGSSAVGSAYCSSFLSYGTVTSYTTTITPLTTATVSTTTTGSATATSTGSATVTLTDSFTSTVPTTTTTTTTTLTTTDTTTTATVYPTAASVTAKKRSVFQYVEDFVEGLLAPRGIEARTTTSVATTSPPPHCLPQYSAPASRLSSACDCLTGSLSITSSTVYTASTAPTSTITLTNTVSTTGTATVQTTLTLTDTTSDTSLISTITTTSTTTTSTVTSTTVTTSMATPYGTNDCVNGETLPGPYSDFTVYCGATLTGLYEVSSSTQSSFSGCYQSCLSFGACDAFTYNIGTGFCLLSDGSFGGPEGNYEFDSAALNF